MKHKLPRNKQNSKVISMAGVAPTPMVLNGNQKNAAQTRLFKNLEIKPLMEGFLGLVQEQLNDVRFVQLKHEKQLVTSGSEEFAHAYSFDLQSQQQPLGELGIGSAKRLNEAQLRTLDELISLLIQPMKNAHKYSSAINSALTDGLTGAGNRLACDAHLKQAIDSADRYQHPLSILLLDLDHFKQINDKWGHNIGDRVLKTVASCLMSNSRCADSTYRFGGDEFIVVLDNTDLEGAKVTAERMRQNIAAAAASQNLGFSVSLGCATLIPGESPLDLLERADQNLLTAKSRGKDCVV